MKLNGVITSLIVPFLMGTAFPATAQKVTARGELGFNYIFHDANTGEGYSLRWPAFRPGVAIGFTAATQIMEDIHLETGMLYDQHRSALRRRFHPAGQVTTEVFFTDETYEAHYLKVPIVLHVRLSKTDPFFLMAGSGVRTFLGGKRKGQPDNGSQAYSGDLQLNTKANNRTEALLRIGFGKMTPAISQQFFWKLTCDFDLGEWKHSHFTPIEDPGARGYKFYELSLAVGVKL